ncbi:hypothetical protein ES703_59316 [subsurface metagenome]
MTAQSVSSYEVGRIENRSIKQSNVYHLPFAAFLSIQQCQCNRVSPKHPRTIINRRNRCPYRWPVGFPCCQHHTRHSLSQRVITRAFPIRSGLPKSRDGTIYYHWIYPTDGLVAQSKPIQSARCEAVYKNVGPGCQFQSYFATFIALQV